MLSIEKRPPLEKTFLEKYLMIRKYIVSTISFSIFPKGREA